MCEGGEKMTQDAEGVRERTDQTEHKAARSGLWSLAQKRLQHKRCHVQRIKGCAERDEVQSGRQRYNNNRDTLNNQPTW